MAFVVRQGEAAERALLGGKAAALSSLRAAKLPIPSWVVVTPSAFEVSLPPERRAALAEACRAGDADAAASALAPLTLSPQVRHELELALAAICAPGERLAVRSSAVDEDGVEQSFAGQLDSVLSVEPEAVPDAIARVWRSGFGARILAYRRERGLSPIPAPPAVLVQRMIEADVSGVAFSADPVTGRRGVVVVSAVCGVGSALVSGEVDGDTWAVDRDDEIIRRETQDVNGQGGHAQLATAPTHKPVLGDQQVRTVATLARRCERHFGRPQDIEWALRAGQLYLVQSRPITTLAEVADPDGAFVLWDNSNIAESYGGITTPLTFSFTRHVYEEVYRQLCRILGVRDAVIAEHSETYRRMLGLIRGRVYYNLLSWYRLLALAPGFTSNRRFMEQMMGVKDGLPDEIVAGLNSANWRDRAVDRWRLLTTVLTLARSYRQLPRDIERFTRRLNHALASDGLDLARMRPDELVTYYRDLEQDLITRWDAPLVNDLFAMMFFGTLRSLTVRWCGDATGSLQNDLLSGEGGMVSAEPAARVRKMAGLAVGHPALIEALCEAPADVAQQALESVPTLAAEYAAYLERFADRCLEELKLESPTLRDDPLPLVRSIGHLARRLGEADPQATFAEGEGLGRRERELRRSAERRVWRALAGHPLRRVIFGWVLQQARMSVRDRENLRFERTRVFGRVRSIFVELGRRFASLNVLGDPRDIFYLEVDEALGFVVGTATTTDLAGLVAVRKAEYARFCEMAAPADRFETRGVVNRGQTYTGTLPVTVPLGESLRGIGCCPGIVRGRARVITNPRGAELRQGEILVAERTDPGWIMLFPAAAGVLVERGSLLSHSAIVAREMGIPAIVSLTGVTGWLRTGDLVEMDGSAGTVVRLSPVQAEEAKP